MAFLVQPHHPVQSLEYVHAVGESPLERLPPEILHQILESITLNRSCNAFSCVATSLLDFENSPATNSMTSPSFLPCLLTSRTLHKAALPVMYRSPAISQFSSFEKLLAQFERYPCLGKSVRRLDLSQASPKHEAAEWSKALSLIERCLRLTPLLRHFRVRQDPDQDLDLSVLQDLFCKMQHIETIDMRACNSSGFIQRFSSFFDKVDFHMSTSLTQLSLHECRDLPSTVFELLLPRLPNLQILDVSNTRITTDALALISASAKLTHLDISHCNSLLGPDLAHFLSSHETVTNSLVFLDLGTNLGADNEILNEEDISQVLSNAPPTLKHLGFKNSNMTRRHIPQLQILCRQLQELCVGKHIRFADVEHAVLYPHQKVEISDEINDVVIDEQRPPPQPIDPKQQIILSPMEEAVTICKLRQRLNSAAYQQQCTPSEECNQPLRYLDISSMSASQQSQIRTSLLLGCSSPLERIEISEEVYLRYNKTLPRLLNSVGWDLKSTGRRCLIFRK